MDIHIIKALSDNYIFCGISQCEDRHSQKYCFLVDPGEAEPVSQFLDEHNLSVKAILLTHHHDDHIGGVLEIKNRYGGTIYGFEQDQNRLPKPLEPLKKGDEISICGYPCRIHFTPGHTSGHIIYHFYTMKVCFLGDVLFSMGCGRVFEGTFWEMYNSIMTIKSLDADTKIYCAHEYTLDNFRFVESLIENQKTAHKDRADEALESLINYENQVHDYKMKAEQKRKQGLPTIPFQLKDEILLNPFMGVSDGKLRAILGLSTLDGVGAFSEIRNHKDHF